MTLFADGWAEAQASERDRIGRRRHLLRDRFSGCPRPEGEVGLALSGGGIRSATFSLGLLKSLSKARLLPSIDYLSTVSGGGYAGSYYCSLFVPPEMRGPAPDLTGQAASRAAARRAKDLGADVFKSAAGRQALAQLRQGGHYLAPNGTTDAVFAGAIGVRNWLAVWLVTGLSVLALFLVLGFPLVFVRTGLTYVHEHVRPGGMEMIPRVRQDQLMGPWLAILFLLSFWPASCAWAYWFARHDPVPGSRLLRVASWQTVVALIIALTAFPVFGNDFYPSGWPTFWRFGLGAVSLGAIAIYALAEARSLAIDTASCEGAVAKDRAAALAQEDRVRGMLNRWLFRGVFWLLMAMTLAGIAWLGRQAHDAFVATDGKGWGEVKVSAVAVFTASVLPVARWLLKTPLGKTVESEFWKTVSRRIGAVASVAIGLGLLIAILTFWSALSYAVMSGVISKAPFVSMDWNLDPKTGVLAHVVAGWLLNPEWVGAATAPAIFTVLLVICVVLLGHIDSLLNGSSLAAFYGSRLRKAYLGATNQNRWGESDVPVDKEHPADEIQLNAYYHDAVLAPLHIINVTINETTSKSSRVIQRDRKGKTMALTPDGCLYPARSPTEPLALIRRPDSEDLPLSSWMAISGAAFSTGAGQHTSFGTALLAGMTNLRLGYWWYSRKKSRWGRWGRPWEWVQFFLLREIRADFEGTDADRWYLSDGGHHENTGVYELVRRRVPFIIASDNGADPKYEFSDLVNLIRKLRIDLDAEVEFVDGETLDDLFADTPLRNVFGTLEQIRRRGEMAVKAAGDSGQPEPAAGPYATLARIHYQPAGRGKRPPPTTLIWIKPRITGKELPDLLQYRDTNLSFPQQPTADQFFDEAQWESYYRLGQLIGDMIFDKRRFGQSVGGARWRPWELEPLPPQKRRKRSPELL